jgi:hypothetical protein
MSRRTVFKYHALWGNTAPAYDADMERATMNLPVYSDILHIEADRDGITVWAEVDDPALGTVVYQFALFGTGCTLPDTWDLGWHHIHTAIDGPFVWHIYMKGPGAWIR